MSDMNRAGVLRRLAGVILGSSLTDDQIVSLAKSLAADRDFAGELSKSLLNSLSAFSRNVASGDLFERQNETQLSGPIKVDHLVKWIVAHNISKKGLIQKLIAKRIVQASAGTLQSESIREIVTRVTTSSSPNAMSKFLDILGMNVEPDAYLEGIEGRRVR